MDWRRTRPTRSNRKFNAPTLCSTISAYPGEEVAYVLEGSLEYRLEGRAPITLHAGEALFIPFGVAHVAKNVGSGKASELATYIVEKGTPLVVRSSKPFELREKGFQVFDLHMDRKPDGSCVACTAGLRQFVGRGFRLPPA